MGLGVPWLRPRCHRHRDVREGAQRPRRSVMGEVCCKQNGFLGDAEEEVARALPVLQVSSTRPRPKKKAKPKSDFFNEDLAVRGKLLQDSWIASPRRLCLGHVPVDRDELVPSSIFVPVAQDQSLPPKPPFAFIRAGKPDFSGSWICCDIAGDMDALMEGLKLTWARRTAARCIKYGKGMAVRNIMQRGNEFVVDCLGTPSVFQQRFHVGRGPQKTFGPDGKVLVTPAWEHGYVLSVHQSELDGSLSSTWQQYFDGEDIVMHVIAMTGASGTWRFSRQ